MPKQGLSQVRPLEVNRSMSRSSPPNRPFSSPPDSASIDPDTRNVVHCRKTLLVKCIILALALVSASYLRWRADSTPPPIWEPIDFKLIQERYDKVGWGIKSSEVEALLGPPDLVQTREPEFQYYDDLVTYRPDRYPSGPFWWLKWTDPNDEGKWVAVFFGGDDTVCYVIKKGFQKWNVRLP